jgi:hypothetical protein
MLRTHIRQRYARESVGGLQGTQFTRFAVSKSTITDAAEAHVALQ